MLDPRSFIQKVTYRHQFVLRRCQKCKGSHGYCTWRRVWASYEWSHASKEDSKSSLLLNHYGSRLLEFCSEMSQMPGVCQSAASISFISDNIDISMAILSMGY